MRTSVSEIIRLLGGVPVNPAELDMILDGVSACSDECRPGTVFVAVKGCRADGHDFLEDAFERGASLAVVSNAAALGKHPGVLVEDSRQALSRLASHFSGSPSEHLTCIGITGTNGKTTINWIIHHLLTALGRKSIRIGTLGTFSEGVISRNEGLTTPDPVRLHSDLAIAGEKGVDVAVMEASSQALHQERVSDIAFDVGVYTNLTRDHLDYHGDMGDYYKAKEMLFSLLMRSPKPFKLGVINIDCPYGRTLLRMQGFESISYGTSSSAMLRISEIENTSRSGNFLLTWNGTAHKVVTGLIGRHNALNVGAAVATCIGLGFRAEEVIDALRQVPQVPGRLQHVSGGGFDIFIDYAHTPDALENALGALREVTRGRLWVVFGCGGDRDRGKRPQMAAVACGIADEVVVTSDNPRNEDPGQIIADIVGEGARVAFVEPDRRRAVRETLSRAGNGDVVLIAGKGHEDYQIVGNERRHFSDLEEVMAALAAGS